MASTSETDPVEEVVILCSVREEAQVVVEATVEPEVTIFGDVSVDE